MLDPSFYPQLSASTQAFIRAGYGLLMIATLVQALPEARRFFLSERWGGYARSSRDVDAFQNPVAMPLLMAIWFGRRPEASLEAGLKRTIAWYIANRAWCEKQLWMRGILIITKTGKRELH